MKITAIEKAWEMNLELDEEDRFKSKEEIMHCECTCNNSFNITLDTPKYCTDGDDDKICTKCWNREIEENTDRNKTTRGKRSEILLVSDSKEYYRGINLVQWYWYNLVYKIKKLLHKGE